MKKIISLILTAFMILSMATAVMASSDVAISLQIDNPYMTVNGVEKEIDPGRGTTPIILNSRTLLPIRAVVEEIGGVVSWDGETQKVTLTHSTNTIELIIGNTSAYLNGVVNALDVAPQIINDRTMLPIRFIIESFGYEVGWIEETRVVTISKASEAINYSEDVLKAVYNATKLIGKDVAYSKDAKITYGQISAAAVNIFMNEYETTYAGLDTEYVFEHQYARAFFVAGRDVLGADFVTLENIDKNATVGDTIDVLTYYLAKRNNNTVTFNKETLLKDVDREAEITHNQFAQLVAELDEIAPIIVKIELTKGNKQTNVPVKINKDLSKYPANSADFRVILEDVPAKAYTEAFAVSNNQKPVINYDFARDYRDIFFGILTPWIDKASDAGVEMKMTYYPALCVENGNGYTMRVKIEILSVDGEKTVGDVFTAADGSKPEIKLNKGDVFFLDLRNNQFIDNVVMSPDYVTIARIIYAK